MNKYRLLSLIFFVIGIISLIIGFIQGEVQTGIFIIFPFVAGSGIFAFLGILCIFTSFLLFFYSYISINKQYIGDFDDINYQGKTSNKKSIKGGGVILIGPIPIVFGSNWKITVLLIILSIILIIFIFFFYMKI